MKGIIFVTEMAQAVRDGRKTQTRRKVRFIGQTPPVKEGETLYVKESVRLYALDEPGRIRVGYKDGDIRDMSVSMSIYNQVAGQRKTKDGFVYWRGGRYMRKEYARTFIKIKTVRVQLLRDITEAEAIAEGFKAPALLQFKEIWARLHSAFIEREWVLVYEFELLK